MNLLVIIESQSKPLKILAGLILIIVISIMDMLTGYEISFSIFYVIPIAFATWFISDRYAIMTSFISAFAWFVADVGLGHVYSYPIIPIWNSLIRLSFFVIIAILLAKLRNAMEREKELASTDYLTGAMNSRLFITLLNVEIDRLQRYKRPFTLVYIDLDDFKTVNDQYGHLTGDQVLRTIVNCADRHLRKTDMIARLGGDEFAILLPETDQESARISLTKLQNGLQIEMYQNNWPITFSIGALTCKAAPPNTSELIKIADELMYQIKRTSKNDIKYSDYTG